jgi:hypothetical protein
MHYRGAAMVRRTVGFEVLSVAGVFVWGTALDLWKKRMYKKPSIAAIAIAPNSDRSVFYDVYMRELRRSAMYSERHDTKM